MVWKVVPDILIIIIFFKGCLITGQQRKSNRGINPSAESFKCTEAHYGSAAFSLPGAIFSSGLLISASPAASKISMSEAIKKA